MIDLRQTREWADWLAATGWVVEKIKLQDGGYFYGFFRPMPLVDVSFMKLQRFEGAIDWEQLIKVKKKYRVFLSVMEPKSEGVVPTILKAGYRLTKEPYLPMKTRVIDLTKSEGELIGEMSENFRRVIKRGVSGQVIDIGPEEFYAGWKRWAKSYILPRGQFDSLVETFGNKAEFWSFELDKELLSAVMLLFTPDTCFYYQTWTSEKGRKNSEHVILTWETMKRAKKLKREFYNFEGIQDKRFPIARWDGFSEFKRRFGGYEVVYPGSFLKWF